MTSVLVVDDDHLVVETMRAILEQAGYHVVAAVSANTALRAFELSQFDVVIVDIFMPDLDGIGTMNMIRKSHPAMPIIIVSGHDFSYRSGQPPNFLGMATKLGAFGSLAKPFTARAFIDLVGRAANAELHPG